MKVVYSKPCLVEVAHCTIKDNPYYAKKFDKISKH